MSEFSAESCYMRDPDGYLIEVGQHTQVALNWFNERT